MKKSKFDARARLQFNAKVNDRTDAVVRVASKNFELGDSRNGSNVGVSVDRAYVNHKFGERVSLKAGRFRSSSWWRPCIRWHIRRCSIQRW